METPLVSAFNLDKWNESVAWRWTISENRKIDGICTHCKKSDEVFIAKKGHFVCENCIIEYFDDT